MVPGCESVTKQLSRTVRLHLQAHSTGLASYYTSLGKKAFSAALSTVPKTVSSEKE